MNVSMRPRPVSHRRPAARKRYVVSDFSGGLDLFRDGAQLDLVHSSDMMNVDPLVGGGVKRRQAVAPAGTYIPTSAVQALGTYVKTDGTQVLLLSQGGSIYSSVFPYSTATLLASGFATSLWRSIQAYSKTYLYSNDGAVARYSWNGTTVTALGVAFNSAAPKYGVYNNGNMPIGKAMAFWHGRMWIANTTESTVSYPNRVRWSYPIVNNIGAEDWHADDYLHLDENGREVLALVPVGESLYCFKRNSIHRIKGWDETNFEQFQVGGAIGAVSADAICVLGSTVFFWDPRTGLRSISANGQLSAANEALLPLIRDDRISLQSLYLGEVKGRIWCSFLVDGLPRTYVLDPDLNEGKGGWLVYDLALGPFVSTWKNGQFGGATPTGDYIEYLTANRDPSVPTRLLRLEQKSKDADDFGSALRSIQSWFRTGWVTDGTPFQLKRQAHLEVIYQAGTAQSFSAQVFSDWDSDNIKTEVKFNRPDQNDNFLKVGQGAIAPSRQEIVRPLGTPRPGAALVVTPGAFVDAIWDDPVVTWDSLTTLWDGGTSLPPGFAHRADGTAYPIPVPIPGGEIYAPVTVTTEPCQESNPLYPVLAPSTTATAYGIARVSIPIARAIQIRFTGALPSKEWAVRAFMGEYREVYG